MCPFIDLLFDLMFSAMWKCTIYTTQERYVEIWTQKSEYTESIYLYYF